MLVCLSSNLSFVKHIDKLLLTAFDASASFSSEAFTVITISCPEINRALICDDILSTVASMLLDSPNPNPLTLHRIAHVTYFVLSSERDGYLICSPYLLQFLHFIDELCVLYFLTKICEDDPSLVDTQNWLLQMHFNELISCELNAPLEFQNTCSYLDSAGRKMIHLYILVRSCLKSSLLKSSFQDQCILDAMTAGINQLPPEVENERWLTLTEMYEDSMKDRMFPLFQYAVDAMATATTSIDRHVVAALDLVTRMVRVDDHVCAYLFSACLPNIILRMIMAFPEHTFLQRSATDFIIAVLQRSGLRVPITDQLIVPLMLEGVSSEFPVLVGASFRVMNAVLKISDIPYKQYLQSIPGFTTFMETTMRPREKLMENGYGGHLPSVWTS